jgi:hypothetical protein
MFQGPWRVLVMQSLAYPYLEDYQQVLDYVSRTDGQADYIGFAKRCKAPK